MIYRNVVITLEHKKQNLGKSMITAKNKITALGTIRKFLKEGT